jgi:hypothetical protein
MKKIIISALLLSVLPFVGCNKAEVIPAPTSSADLKIHFEGIINGSDVEWTKNVLKYAAVPSDSAKAFYDAMTGTNYLNLSYYCSMKSTSEVSYIAIGLGSIQQDPTLGTRPNATTFKTFMDSNSMPLMPAYSDTANTGFEVRYVDAQGRLFRSDESVPGLVSFYDLEEKEDDNGAYIQFKCDFTCLVKYWGKTVTLPKTDSVLATATIQNATLTGYFKR